MCMHVYIYVLTNSGTQLLHNYSAIQKDSWLSTGLLLVHCGHNLHNSRQQLGNNIIDVHENGPRLTLCYPIQQIHTYW